MQEEITRDLHVRSSSVALWFGALAGPLSFLIAQEIKYVAVQFVCTNHMTWIFWVTALVALGVTAAAGFAAGTHWHSTDQRVHFMAIGGVVINAMSALAIIALCIPYLFFTPCD